MTSAHTTFKVRCGWILQFRANNSFKFRVSYFLVAPSIFHQFWRPQEVLKTTHGIKPFDKWETGSICFLPFLTPFISCCFWLLCLSASFNLRCEWIFQFFVWIPTATTGGLFVSISQVSIKIAWLDLVTKDIRDVVIASGHSSVFCYQILFSSDCLIHRSSLELKVFVASCLARCLGFES